MPIYEYKCNRCGYRFEIFQKHNDPHLDTCYKCGGKLNKLISPPALQFKGNGWYVTDYAKKKAEEKDSKPAEKTESTKSDSAEKPEPSPSCK